MDKNTIKKINYTLSAQNITSYDLLLAMGAKDLVPNVIIQDRLTRVLKRDGKETVDGYLRNALEELSKANFANKDEMLKLLRSQITNGGLSGLTDFSDYSKLWLLAIVGIVVFCCWRRRKTKLFLVSGRKTKK